jgi:hypothetical protein
MKVEESIKEKVVSVLANQEQHQYEKPLFEEQIELTFPRELLEVFNGEQMCIQCSSCHGCR